MLNFFKYSIQNDKKLILNKQKIITFDQNSYLCRFSTFSLYVSMLYILYNPATLTKYYQIIVNKNECDFHEKH